MTDPLAPCPDCGAEWSEVYDLDPVDAGEGVPDDQPEGGLTMQHDLDCPRIPVLAEIAAKIDDSVFT